VTPKPADSRRTFSAHDWSRFLTARLSRPVSVSFGRARRRVIVAQRLRGDLAVRMNAFFEHAPDDVREATATWLRSGRRARAACQRLDRWIDEAQTRYPTPTRRAARRVRGEAYDLAELAVELIHAEFPRTRLAGRRAPGLTWGRRGKARRTLQLGSYDPEEDLIRIHPVLDQPAVPRFFLRYVLFHELLHALQGSAPPVAGRRRHHDAAFVERERGYRDYERAIGWQDRHIGALLRSARTGRPLALPPRPRAAERIVVAIQLLLFPDRTRRRRSAARGR